MRNEQTESHVVIRLGIEGGTLWQYDAIPLQAALQEAAGPDAIVAAPFVATPKGVHAMAGVEAVIATIALPSLAFVAKAVRDVILEHMKAKANASVEIETPDGRKVKISGPEARGDRVLEILRELAKQSK